MRCVFKKRGSFKRKKLIQKVEDAYEGRKQGGEEGVPPHEFSVLSGKVPGLRNNMAGIHDAIEYNRGAKVAHFSRARLGEAKPF